MENILSNKAKFFAQYWGQKVMKKNIDGLENFITEPDGFIRSISNEVFLELKPLSSISYEDLNYVCKIIGEERSNPFSDIGRRNTFSYLHGRMMPSIEIYKSIEVVDYLRSRGYALPWMGLSVGTILEYGWVKLK